MALGPGKPSWHGLSCLLLTSSGFSAVHLLEQEELGNPQMLPEEQKRYQLVNTIIEGSLPFTVVESTALIRSVESGHDHYLCYSGKDAALL
ncbi:unnamed protein product, partial [Durusdinium trenchii]